MINRDFFFASNLNGEIIGKISIKNSRGWLLCILTVYAGHGILSLKCFEETFPCSVLMTMCVLRQR